MKARGGTLVLGGGVEDTGQKDCKENLGIQAQELRSPKGKGSTR